MGRVAGTLMLAGIVFLAYKCNSDTSNGPTYAKGQAAGISAAANEYLCHFVAGSQPPQRPSLSRSPIQFKTNPVDDIRSGILNISSDNTLSVHYANGDWKIYPNDHRDITTFLSYVSNRGTVVIEGYASITGSPELNDRLSKDRAKGVEALISGIRPDIRIQMAHYGNTRAKNTDSKAEQALDRKVIVIYGDAIARGLASKSAGYYLLDKSTSMRGNKWAAVQSFPYPAGSKIVTFAAPNHCAATFAQEEPHGRTPLFTSISGVMDIMNPGEKLTVLTDGVDTGEGGVSRFEVIRKANEKGIKVQCVSVEMGMRERAAMEEIVKATNGGSCYSIERL